MDLSHTPIVFLHVPKTAGQTVHNGLAREVKAARVSPIRVHTESPTQQGQFPPGYSLYSGHLDWQDLGHLPSSHFVFTVLRDPAERIASFYFYLQREAACLDREVLNKPQNIGLRRAVEWSPDDYFFGGDDLWQTFVRSHYDNFYCTYFATRRMLGWGSTQDLAEAQLLTQAKAGLAALDRVYSTKDMALMETEFAEGFGMRLRLCGRFDNSSGEPANSLRWPRLLASFATDHASRKLQDFITRDQDLTIDFL